jgi:hypothetical protein
MTEIFHDKLREYLIGLGINRDNITITDEFLRLPDPTWVTDEFSTWFAKLLNVTKYDYRLETRDCENFAEFARVWAQYTHSKTPGSENGESGLAFGVFCYVTENISGHALNGAVCDVGGKPKLLFFEPQPTQVGSQFWKHPLMESKLTPKEISSCTEFWV